MTLACGGVVVAPSSAMGHSNEPRTAVIFDDVNTCALTVDRAADPTVMMTYSIAMEDLPNPDHDLPDAKTHQFIAVCRSWSTREPPPRYLAVDDLQRSIDIGYEEPSALDDPEMTFETSIVWENCWRRITADDARLPLTPDAALDGVVWDTTDVEAPAWFPVGPSFDPPGDRRERAPYAIRVEDDLAAPVDAGDDWSLEHILEALERGPHQSAMQDGAAEFLRQETIDKVKHGYARVVRWGEIKLQIPNSRILIFTIF